MTPIGLLLIAHGEDILGWNYIVGYSCVDLIMVEGNHQIKSRFFQAVPSSKLFGTIGAIIGKYPKLIDSYSTLYE